MTESHPRSAVQPPSVPERFLQWILRRFWYVHPGIHFHLQASPSQIYRALEIACKPSVKRLDHRKLFTQGRRYFITTLPDGGFRLKTTSKVNWHPRRRTSPTAIAYGIFERVDDEMTRLTVRSRIRVTYGLQFLLWPTFISSLIIYMDWSRVLMVALILTLYSLSWIAHRVDAMLDANEMMFFIETVLEPFAPSPPPQLGEQSADIIYEQDFAEVWDRFVEEMQDE